LTTMEIDAETPLTEDAPAAAEAVPTATAASGVHPGKARPGYPSWTTSHARALDAATSAARAFGGASVQIKFTTEGTVINMELKHSKESVSPVITAHEKIRLEAAAAETQQQQRRIQKMEEAAARTPPSQPSKSARKRAAKKEKLKVLAARLEHLEAEKASADPTTEERFQGVMRHALEAISKMAGEACASDPTNLVVQRRVAFGPGGAEAVCDVPAGSAGASYSADVFGDKLRKAFEGLPNERLSAALETLVKNDLFSVDVEADHH